jgi:hypothetical protein
MILLAARRSLLALLIAAPLAAQTRIASDFEIQQMERQVARSTDFLSQLSGHLNLGDLRAARNESALARGEYRKALEIAEKERLDARRASAMTRYATATSYAALADAKLQDAAHAFALSEEALRYTSDSAKTWNLVASTMSVLRRPAKAVSAARNAVAMARRDVQQSPTTSNRLDLGIYEYTLASSLIDLNQTAEAEQLLLEVVTSLNSNEFTNVKRDVARTESFEIYSSARGEGAAYVSLLNRAQLRLARLYEDRGDIARARAQYESVLADRSDDPTALTALARLARTPAERERYYADAFDANPFSLPLIRDYQRYLSGAPAPSPADASTTGARVRLTLQQMQRGELVAATATIDALMLQFPDNDTLKQLRREIQERRASAEVPAFLRSRAKSASPTAAELRSVIALFRDDRLTAEQRTQLDAMTFISTAVFSGAPAPPPATAGQTIFETGTIDAVPFRFAEPTAFNGTFAPQTPLRLTYRILGATQQEGADALLLEPLRLEALR